jgi:signal transduction histidine kinase
MLLAGAFAIRAALDGALRPVARMTSSAADWGAHDLDRRFDLGPPRDELTGLAATLDGLLTRIASSRRHEQRFASEMAHELRTPVAGIRGRAELALADADEAERAAALSSIVAQADRLDTTISTLMAIARRELDPTAGAVDLAAVAREQEGVQLRQAKDVPLAAGEPELVRRVLAPLLENAHRHARAHVWLDLTASDGMVRLAVHDDGPGLDPELGESAFEPGARGAREGPGGAGLGLPLARRMARSCGGDVVLGDGPGGCFVLELPALGAGG